MSLYWICSSRASHPPWGTAHQKNSVSLIEYSPYMEIFSKRRKIYSVCVESMSIQVRASSASTDQLEDASPVGLWVYPENLIKQDPPGNKTKNNCLLNFTPGGPCYLFLFKLSSTKGCVAVHTVDHDHGRGLLWPWRNRRIVLKDRNLWNSCHNRFALHGIQPWKGRDRFHQRSKALKIILYLTLLKQQKIKEFILRQQIISLTMPVST